MSVILESLNPFNWPLVEQVNFIEQFYYVRILIFKCGFKRKTPFNYFFEILAIILTAYTTFLVNTYVSDKMPLALPCLFVLLFIYSRLFLDGTAGYQALIIFAGWIFLIVADTSMALIAMAYYHGDMSFLADPQAQGMWSLFGKIIEAFMLEMYMRYSANKKIFRLSAKLIPVMYIFLTYDSIIMFLMITNKSAGILLVQWLLYIVEIIISFTVFYQFTQINIREEEINQLERDGIELEKRMSQLEQTKEQYYKIREMRHDLKHHIRYMDSLIDDEQITELKEYLVTVQLQL